MQVQTNGVVLHTISFSESALIAHIYTQKYGMQSYLVNKVRTGKTRNRFSSFQPLTIVELEVFHKESRELQKITKIQPELSFQFEQYSPVKSAIAFFLSEVLYKALKEEESHESLFDFLNEQIRELYFSSESNCVNFHVFFLIKLSRFLGFSPQPAEQDLKYFPFFDLKEGIFVEKTPSHPNYIKGLIAEKFNELLLMENESVFQITRVERKELLNILLKYYALHIPGLKTIKSIDVLEAIFA